MKSSTRPQLIYLLLVIWCLESSSRGFAAEKKFEGTIAASLTRAGTDAQHYVFTRKDNLLRIENTSNKLEPINILDLAAKSLTIVYPHNTTFVRVDLTKKRAPPGMPPLPAGFPTPPPLPAAGAGAPGMLPMPQGAGLPGGSGAARPPVGPNFSPPPGFPSPPPMPSLPPPGAGAAGMPQPPSQGFGAPGIPVGAAPNGASGARAGLAQPALPNQIPSMPPMPNNPMGMGIPAMPRPAMTGPTDLKKADQDKKIQGFDCALYTVSDRGETLEIWAANDSTLFPFRLIERDFIGRRFGPQMIEETWPEMLRNKSLFPLEATLKMEPGGHERLTFRIEKIEQKKIEDDKLFQPPEKYIEIQAPQF